MMRESSEWNGLRCLVVIRRAVRCAQAFSSNASFLADRGATLSVWRRYSDFHRLHLDLLSCVAGASTSVLKGIPQPPPKTWRPSSGSAPSFIEGRRNKLEVFLHKVLASPVVDAPLNPYVLEFLGLSPLPQPAGGAVAYEPLVVQGAAAPTAAPTAMARATSAEHRAAMHRCAPLPSLSLSDLLLTDPCCSGIINLRRSKPGLQRTTTTTTTMTLYSTSG